MTLSDQIRKAIRECGDTPHSVAIKSGISAPQLYRFLSGERGLTLDTIDKIGQAIGLRVIVERND